MATFRTLDGVDLPVTGYWCAYCGEPMFPGLGDHHATCRPGEADRPIPKEWARRLNLSDGSDGLDGSDGYI